MNNKRVTIKEQKEHLAKINRLENRIAEYEKSEISHYESLYLDSEELDVIKRALMVHKTVITLDMKKRKDK